jgi:3-oxoacyl-[acyl-carrier protein] reductase
MQKIIIVGASSELAQHVANNLSKTHHVINVSRKHTLIDCCSSVQITDYTTAEINKFISSLSKSDTHTFIFFNGVSDSEIFINISTEEIDFIIQTNLTTPILFTKLVLKKFISKKTKYIYLTSTRALNGDKGIALYSTTKSALKFFAKSLALEYGKFEQYFHVISLGIFNHGLIKKVKSKKLEEIKKNAAIQDYVEIDELLKAIKFIIDSDASTGSVTYVDNGLK